MSRMKNELLTNVYAAKYATGTSTATIFRTTLRVRAMVLVCCGALLLGCPSKPAAPGKKPTGNPTDPAQTEHLPLTDAQQIAMAEAFQRGLAELENLHFTQSIAAYDSILKQVPDSLPVLQNRAIAAMMQFEELNAAGESKEQKAAAQQAQTVLSDWEQVSDKSPVLHLLKARLAVGNKQPLEVIVSEFEKAIQLNNADSQTDSLSLTYAKFAALSSDPNAIPQADDALLATLELDAANVQLLLDCLQRTVDHQPNLFDDTIRSKVLTQLAHEIRFLASGIQQRTRLNPLDSISQLQQSDPAADSSTWKRHARVLINVLRPETLTQSDKARLAKNLLEYLSVVQPEFVQAAQKLYASQQTQVSPLKWNAQAVTSLPVSAVPASEPASTEPVPSEPVLSDDTLSAASSSAPRLALPPVAALADFNLDGIDDLVVAQDQRLLFFTRASADQNWSAKGELPIAGQVQQIVCVDLDNDFSENNIATPIPGQAPPCRTASIDLVLLDTLGMVTLCWNRGLDTEGVAQWETRPLGDLLGEAGQVPVSQLVAFDLEADGDLDLAGVNEQQVVLWRQNTPKQFSDISDQSQLQFPDSVQIHLDARDLDNDIDLDLVIGIGYSDDRGNELVWLENLRHGQFRTSLLGLEREGISDLLTGTRWLLAAIEDFNSDGGWDFLLVPQQHSADRVSPSKAVESEAVTAVPVPHVVSTSSRSGLLDVISAEQFPEPITHILSVADLDNNGVVDVVVAQQDELHPVRRTYGLNGVWIADESIGPVSTHAGSVARLLSTYTPDGACELYSLDSDGVSLTTMQTAPSHQFLSVTLLAQQVKTGGASASGRVNSYGIGSTIEVRAGGFFTKRVVDSPVMHIGLGAVEKAESVRVLWTNGIPGHAVDVTAGTYLCEKQELKGSCPYLYAWNGTEMDFVTDLLWASPIGLVNPVGEMIPARPREELLIREDQLQPLNGRYRLSVTEELWEFSYFDQIELTVVDHPEGTQLFTNEKVGPPAVSIPEWHLVKQRQPIRRAVSGDGRDLLELITHRDDQYAVPFTRRIQQGLTDPSTLELRFDPFRPGERVRLVMTGWIYPTDTSINIQMSQSADSIKPMPLSLWVPNGKQDWVLQDSFIGFPGGKTKPIVIDITPYVNPDAPLVQLRTSLELAWDEIFVVVGEESIPYRAQPARLLSADLHSRGYSETRPHRHHGPDHPMYNNVTRQQKWSSLSGNLTRFGSVSQLLESTDNQLVVFGPGDELLLQFEEPLQAPPEGWIREYVIVNTGWDKDADLNTVYGTTVEPLPFVKMSSYPFPAEEAEFQQSTRFLDYLKTYQTRPSR